MARITALTPKISWITTIAGALAASGLARYAPNSPSGVLIVTISPMAGLPPSRRICAAPFLAHNMKARPGGSRPMKLNIDIDLTPQEARHFLGLPDVSSLNDHLVAEMKKRLDANIAMAAPEELMKNWIAFGGQASEQFMKLMTAAAASAASFKGKGSG